MQPSLFLLFSNYKSFFFKVGRSNLLIICYRYLFSKSFVIVLILRPKIIIKLDLNTDDVSQSQVSTNFFCMLYICIFKSRNIKDCFYRFFFHKFKNSLLYNSLLYEHRAFDVHFLVFFNKWVVLNVLGSLFVSFR